MISPVNFYIVTLQYIIVCHAYQPRIKFYSVIKLLVRFLLNRFQKEEGNNETCSENNCQLINIISGQTCFYSLLK